MGTLIRPSTSGIDPTTPILTDVRTGTAVPSWYVPTVQEKNADPASWSSGFFNDLGQTLGYYWQYKKAETSMDLQKEWSQRQMAAGLSPSAALLPGFGGINPLTIFIIGGVLIFGIVMLKR